MTTTPTPAARPLPVRLFDTYTRVVRDFVPLHTPDVGVYCCGLTVYDYAHIGNLRTYIFEDLLVRALRNSLYHIRHVQNITDVGHLVSDADEGEDKMEKGARRTGKTAWEIAAFYTEAFKADFRRLNILPPDVWCKATDHIPEQIAMIECIAAGGFTYRTKDGVYFDTAKQADYGYLARLDIADLQAGARVSVGEKRNPTDFALWKFSPPGQVRQMAWDSPWGRGFPGWHIECSAMARKYLGPLFDIHCGGEDHIPVHHTNEIAQTKACDGTHLADYWLHGYFLQLDDSKMSKSAGEFLRLQVLIDKGYDPLAYRMLCLSAHYRTQLNFTWDALDGALTALNRLRAACNAWGTPGQVDVGLVEKFTQQVNDDLNLPRAMAVTWELVHSSLPPAVKKATLIAFDRVLGLGLAEWQPPVETAEAIPADVQALAEARQAARAGKRWTEADQLRFAIRAKGYEVEDTPVGPVIRRR